MSTEPTRPEQVQVCATCKRPLDWVRNPDGSHGYAHGDQVLRGVEDHLPMPEDPTDQNTDPACDFCFLRESETGRHKTVVCRPFSIRVEDTIEQFSALWAACPECALLIEARWWRGLVRRAEAEHRRRYPEGPDLSETLRILYNGVRMHLVEVRDQQAGELSQDWH